MDINPIICKTRIINNLSLINHLTELSHLIFYHELSNYRTNGRRTKWKSIFLVMELIGIRDEMTSHFLTLLRKVYVACDDNSSKFFRPVRLKERAKDWCFGKAFALSGRLLHIKDSQGVALG